MTQKELELLSPAKNLEQGIAAINHGADAVYIGAARFSARSAAGNNIRDIEKLAAYAHFYRARLYIALNTLIYDHELDEARQLIHRLWNAGADALIIQDMGILELDIPPIPLFASTQTDNRTVSRIRFLESAGFRRVILARELSLSAIRNISEHTGIELETFVHGSLCASYSGRCYFSAAIGKRSANRGECGQPCRLAWNLVNSSKDILEKDRHLLSLKDMNRSARLHDLISAGVTSFKIEGRLKDMAYVKNITAFYRRKLDELMANTSGFKPASSGRTELYFTPDPKKTFNRGETDYFPTDRQEAIHSMNTPKSVGEPIGMTGDVDDRYFTLEIHHDLHNGDGICFFDSTGKLFGFQVNRADREKIFPAGRPGRLKNRLVSGTVIYRNHDHLFLKKLSGPSSERKIALDLTFFETMDGFVLQGMDEDGFMAEARLDTEKIKALNETGATSTLKNQLGRIGDSRFYLRTLSLESSAYFIPAKALNRVRRDLLTILTARRNEHHERIFAKPEPETAPFDETRLDFTANVSNQNASAFYQKRGVKTIDPAFEIAHPGPGTVVMTLKHCILNALGQCRKKEATRSGIYKDPLYIENTAGRFLLEFDCTRCEMRIRT